MGKLKHVKREAATGAHELALRTVQSQIQAIAGAGGHRQSVALREIEHHAIGIGLVDGQGHRTAAQTQSVNANHPHRSGGRLQGHPFARGDTDAALLRQCQGKLQTTQAQAHGVCTAGVQANKRVQARTTNGQQVCRHGRGFVGRCAHFVSGLQLGALALQGQVALHGHKVHDIEVQVAAGLQQLTVAASHIQYRLSARPCGDRERVGRIVNHLTVGGRTVDGNGQVLPHEGHAIDTHHGGFAGRGLQTEPLACGAGGDLLAGHDQADVHTRQLQTHGGIRATVHTRKGAHIAQPHGQDVHIDVVSIGQLHAVALLVQCDVARELNKTKHVDVRRRTHAHQGTIRAVHVQRQIGGGAGGDDCCGLAGGVIHQRPIGCGTVDLNSHIRGVECEAVHANKGRTLGTGLHAQPLACTSSFGEQRHPQLHATQAQAGASRIAAIDTDEGVQPRTTDQQGINRNGCARACQRDVGTGFFYRQAAAERHKVGNHHVKRATGLQQLALAAIERQRQGARSTRGDGDGADQGVQHGVIGAAGLVDRDVHVARTQCEIAHTGERGCRCRRL